MAFALLSLMGTVAFLLSEASAHAAVAVASFVAGFLLLSTA